MILPDNVVGYIDFGITGAISEYSRENLVALTLAYTRGDLDAMADAFFKVCVIGAPDGPSRFRAGLRAMSRDWYERSDGAARLQKNFTLVMLDMLRLSHRTSVWPERDVIKYIRSAIAIDGLITRFAPSFDVGAYLEQVCAQHLRWQARLKLLRSERAFEWLAASARVIRRAPGRAEAILDRFASGHGSGVTTVGGGQRPVLLLAAIVVGLAAATAVGDPTAAGGSFHKAQLVVGGVAAARLCLLMRRLA
jgi:ubiquinone biosynthesis protein